MGLDLIEGFIKLEYLGDKIIVIIVESLDGGNILKVLVAILKSFSA